MALLDWFWRLALAPFGLMPVLWPLFIALPIFGGVLGLVMRALAVRRVGLGGLHPIMRSPLRWMAVTALGGFAVLYVLVAVSIAVLTWAVLVRQAS